MCFSPVLYNYYGVPIRILFIKANDVMQITANLRNLKRLTAVIRAINAVFRNESFNVEPYVNYLRNSATLWFLISSIT